MARIGLRMMPTLPSSRGDEFHSEMETIPPQSDTVGVAGEITDSLSRLYPRQNFLVISSSELRQTE
jgi:hypothetical protein